jgi:hypothetical protein
VPKYPVTPPPRGQRFVDRDGVHWSVTDVINDSARAGFFLVRLDHGKTEECRDASLMLAPMEYEALVRARGLRALAPDVLYPVKVFSPVAEAPDAAAHVTVSR